jgi:hypothetical protein
MGILVVISFLQTALENPNRRVIRWMNAVPPIDKTIDEKRRCRIPSPQRQDSNKMPLI